ncbi:glycosyltransferase family 4 protein [Frondihabitans australicus]|uniref:Glycosyltransferase involved in cell wall biosynthesis n=1 Tax=Frondihabitans australicus TaxID=386892 RepID=A0A495IL61_9MICO|nr:glycosyltransferase family 4 protein [Frondihabitans australicus]RKR76683.1 glycosyltransferase involved in cell wall biosynthesis [Frondihabitans australicus]
MRILTGTEVLSPQGGLEVCVFEDAIALADAGHDVTLLYTRDGSQRPFFERAGVRLWGPVRFLFDPRRAVKDLARFVRSALRTRRLGVDVLWLNRPENIIWAQVVSRLARVPLVVHLHHAPNYRWERLLMRGVAHSIAVSDYMKTVWTDAGVPADRISVVSNALPAGKYRPATPAQNAAARERLGVTGDARVVLYYGRITRNKGVLTALEAWKTLGLDPSRAVLVLAGNRVGAGSDDDQAIGEALEALQPGSVVRLPNQDDVSWLLHAADLVVAPSWEPESFGRTVVEAFSAGLPAIGSDLGGAHDILSGPLERFSVPSRDSGALAAKIESLLDWRVAEPALGRVVTCEVARRFSYDDHLAGIVRILEAAAGGGRARGRRSPVGNSGDGVAPAPSDAPDAPVSGVAAALADERAAAAAGDERAAAGDERPARASRPLDSVPAALRDSALRQTRTSVTIR